jgi:hypothetical protein
MGALHQEHLQALENIRVHRHKLAHELANFLVDPNAEVDTRVLSDLRNVMAALDRFWSGIDVQTNPDFDGTDVDLDGGQTGSGILFAYLFGLADTDEPLSGQTLLVALAKPVEEATTSRVDPRLLVPGGGTSAHNGATAVALPWLPDRCSGFPPSQRPTTPRCADLRSLADRPSRIPERTFCIAPERHFREPNFQQGPTPMQRLM